MWYITCHLRCRTAALTLHCVTIDLDLSILWIYTWTSSKTISLMGAWLFLWLVKRHEQFSTEMNWKIYPCKKMYIPFAIYAAWKSKSHEKFWFWIIRLQFYDIKGKIKWYFARCVNDIRLLLQPLCTLVFIQLCHISLFSTNRSKNTS